MSGISVLLSKQDYKIKFWYMYNMKYPFLLFYLV